MRKRSSRRSIVTICAAGIMAVGAVCPAMAESLADYSEKLHVMYEIDEVKSVDEASSYQVEWIQVEKEKAEQALLHSEVVSEKPDATGIRIETKSDEMEELLYLYDGGKASGVTGCMFGGIRYWCLTRDGEASPSYDKQVNVYMDHPETMEQLARYDSRIDFSQEAELEFADRTETVNDIEKLLEDISGVELEVSKVYSLDQETMREHAERLHKQNAIWGEMEERVTEKEAYLIQLRQVVDGILLANHNWAMQGFSVTEMQAEAIVSEDGLEETEMKGAVTVQQEIAKGKLISPQEAEAIYLEELKKTILVSDLYVENLELNYVVVQNGKQLEMVPAWIFCIARKVKTEPVEPNGEDMIWDYSHMVINAETGEQILNME